MIKIKLSTLVLTALAALVLLSSNINSQSFQIPELSLLKKDENPDNFA